MKYFDQYKKLHETKRYGISGSRLHNEVAPHIPVGMESLLDYGAGQSDLAKNLGKLCSIKDVHSYDPCVVGRDNKPERNFDFVTCTDVMEHVPEEEVDGVLTDIWGYAEKGALFMIALREAAHVLPNGENCHCTVQPKDWWEERLRSVWNEVHYLPKLSKKYCVAAFLVRPSSS